MANSESDPNVSKAVDVSHEEVAKPAVRSGDDALKVLGDHVEAVSEEEYAAVLKKIDWRLLPVLTVLNATQLIDKNTLGAAATYGLIDQANLQGPEFSMLVTLFYLGYLLAEYPANYLMQKFPIGKCVMVTFISWGIVLACTAGATSFPGLAAGRFFLGVFEAPLNPALVIITSSWWKKAEQPRRLGIWYSLVGVINMLVVLAFYGIAHMNVGGLFPYQWMFLIFGGVTILIGISLYWILPDSPTTARFLNDRERLVAVQRIQENQTGLKNREHKKYQILEAIKDPKVWLLGSGVFFQNMTNSLQNSFNGLIIKGLGFDTYQSVLLTMPGNAVSLIACLSVTWFLGSSWGQGKRIFAIMIMYLPGLISTAILYAVPISRSSTGILLFAITFINAISTSASIMYSLLASNIGGYTKKSVVNSMFFVFYSLGNITAPQTFLQSEAPRYTTGVGVTLAAFCANITGFGILYLIYRASNKKRDREAAQRPPMSEDERMRQAFSDLTDNENRNLRYAI